MKQYIIIIICSLFFNVCYSQQQFLMKKQAEGGLLLDNVTNASAAYSFSRKLISSFSGTIIEVERADNSSTSEVGLINDDLDVSSLSTFCAGTDCYISKVKDQITGTWATKGGSNDAIIYDNSTGVVTYNNKPAIKAPSGNGFYLDCNRLIVELSQGDRCFYTVSSNDNTSTGQRSYILSEQDNTPYSSQFILGGDTGNNIIWVNGTNIGSYVDPSFFLINYTQSNSNIDAYANNNTVASSVVTVNTETVGSTTKIAARADGLTSFFRGDNAYIMEVVVFSEDKSTTDINKIKNNVNNFYSLW